MKWMIFFVSILGSLITPVLSEAKPQQILIVLAGSPEATVAETNEMLLQMDECGIIHQTEHKLDGSKLTIMIRYEVKSSCNFTTFNFPPITTKQRTPAEWRALGEELRRKQVQ